MLALSTGCQSGGSDGDDARVAVESGTRSEAAKAEGGTDGGQGGARRRGLPKGRWHKSGWLEVPLEEERDLTEAQMREFARLRSIGYLPGSSPIPMNTGVVVYDGPRTWDALNFYTSGHGPEALLIDMTGNRLHRWKKSFTDAWDEQPGDTLPASLKGSGYWRRAALLENGDVVAVFEGKGIIKIDRDSNLIWARFGGHHHDLEVTADGLIYTLTREPRVIPELHPELPILEDFVIVLDADGNELIRVSVIEALRNSEFAWFLDETAESGDILHTNTIELLDGRLAHRVEGFDEGNVLICIREIGALAVLDLERREAVWGVTADWVMPHQPTVLDNGNILLFDNRGHHGYSRVIEFDPTDMSREWTYAGDEPGDFYSKECGSNQRLPNGNTLITESDRGKALEVTPDGTVVWKFLNPMRAGGRLEYIATLFEAVRLPRDFPLDWLARDRKGDTH